MSRSVSNMQQMHRITEKRPEHYLNLRLFQGQPHRLCLTYTAVNEWFDAAMHRRDSASHRVLRRRSQYTHSRKHHSRGIQIRLLEN